MLRHSHDFKLADYQISPLTVTELAEKIVQHLEADPQSQKHSAIVVTLNLENTYFLSKNRNYIDLTDLFVADGWPIQLLSNCFNKTETHRIQQRCTGADLCPLLLSDKRLKDVFIVGGKGHAKLIEQRPKTQETWMHFFEAQVEQEHYEQILNRIRESRSRLVLVALNTPKAFPLMEYLKNQSKGLLIVGVGSSIDFLTGEKKRAPLFLQKLNLEWFWRFLMEPRRMFLRYFVISPLSFLSLIRNHCRLNRGK